MRGSALLKKNEIQPRHYRDAMANFAGHVHIVTTDGPAGRRGTTVIAACSVSDDPPTVLVCLMRTNPANEMFMENGVFALNTLGHHHEKLANAFSGLGGLSQDERFARAKWDTISTGAPTLVDALSVFDCRIVEAKDMATHRVLFGKVTGLRVGNKVRPLIYHDRNYHGL
jgi:cob(II)yrinic acid a,c-diamide reductase